MRGQRDFLTGTLIITLAISLGLRGTAQPPLPIIKNATVAARVNFDPSSHIFSYNYTLTNSPESMGSIEDFKFDISSPSGGETLSLDGLKSRPGTTLGDQFLRLQLDGSVIPVVFVNSSGWYGSLSLDKTAGWFISMSRGPVPPGQSIGNLSIQSPGLAGIRGFILKPPFNPNNFLPNIDNLPPGPNLPQEIAQEEQELAQMQQKIIFQGQTLGPTALPQNCDSVCMVQFLANEKEQAFQLGWITNAGVANALDAKLNEAQKKLQAGDTQVAINILKSFILDLEAQHQGQTGQGGGASKGNAQTSGKHVTDNAYYLLKPNAEFILDKLGATSIP